MQSDPEVRQALGNIDAKIGALVERAAAATAAGREAEAGGAVAAVGRAVHPRRGRGRLCDLLRRLVQIVIGIRSRPVLPSTFAHFPKGLLPMSNVPVVWQYVILAGVALGPDACRACGSTTAARSGGSTPSN